MISGMQAYDPPVDHEALLDTYIRALNACTRDRPSDMIVSVHCCRGNYKGGVWFSEGGYDRVARKLFGDLDADRYLVKLSH
jgi:methionine synthase II (cobalamin-independent)